MTQEEREELILRKEQLEEALFYMAMSDAYSMNKSETEREIKLEIAEINKKLEENAPS